MDPVTFGPQYFREKYNCDPSNTKQVYYKEARDDSEDFTKCEVQVADESHPDCKTEVTFCVAEKSGHWWWSSETDVSYLPQEM